MPLSTDLPTTKTDGDASHTAGHNATNTRVNAIATEVNAHEAATTSVHGITNTAALETTTGSAAKVTTHAAATDPHGDRAFATSAVATHEADTTSVHGIADTAALATTAAVAAGYQPLDADLTAIAGLTATTDNFVQSKSSAWASRTPAQVAADLVSPLSSSLQPIDSDLTAIAALSPSNDDLVQRKAGAWTNRTPAQVKTDLALTASDVSLGNVANAAQVQLGTVDAKGDLLVGTADNTIARVAVGTNTHVLTADSTQTAGVKWAAASGGGGSSTANVARIYAGSDQAASYFSVTNITLDTVQFNRGSGLSTATANKITVGSDGVYFCCAEISVLDDSDPEARNGIFVVNGTSMREFGATSDGVRLSASTILPLSNGDQVSLSMWTGASTPTIEGVNPKNTGLTVLRLGD